MIDAKSLRIGVRISLYSILEHRIGFYLPLSTLAANNHKMADAKKIAAAKKEGGKKGQDLA